MTYSRPETNSTNAGYVITEQRNSAGALLAKSQHHFYGSPRASFNQEPTHYAAWQDGREYQTESFDTNGTTVLRRVTNTFQQRAAVSWWGGTAETAPPNDPRLVDTTTNIEPNGANLVAKQVFGFDDSVPFNNQNNVKEHDFGIGVSGPPLRETRTTFVTDASYTGNDVHLRSMPLQVSIHDSNGVERARASSEFDNYTTDTNHAALLNRSGISGFDSAFSATYTTRGNATATSQYLLVNGSVTGSVTGFAQYDIAGNVVRTINARGHSATLDFSDRFGGPDGEARGNNGATELAGMTSYAFPTLVANSLGQTAYTQFDYYLGRPVDGEDANGIVASGYYNDLLDRPTQIISAANQGAPVKSQTTFAYDDQNRIITTTSDLSAFGDNLLKSQAVYDGLGRTTDKRQYESASTYITVRQTYDALGRAYQTSNPFRAGETILWTTGAYDALGRGLSVTTPDNAVVSTSHLANTVTVTDQAGKQRKSVSDGLGRLKEVYEAPNDANYNHLTSYSYDTLDNLTKVTQGTQPPREFAYDSLKRLTSAINLESGTVSYQYDDNGNLLVKTDARGVSSHYDYDALNRVTRRWYNGSSASTATTHNSPALPSGVGASDEVKYFYDSQSLPGGAPSFDRGFAIGRLVATTYGGGSAGDYYGFDASGRAKLKIQQTGGISYQTTASYNLAGAVISMSYPSGGTINNAYDSAGRLQSFTGYLGDGMQRTYASDFEYTPWNGLQQEKFGTTTPVYHKQRYNARGQLWDMRASTVSFATDPANGDRGAIVNHYSNTFTQGGSGTDNNGNLLRQENYIPSSSFFQDNFDYDQLSRLKSMAEKLNGAGTDSFKQAYIYDRWGNRTIDQANTSSNIPKPNFGVNTATNQLTAPAGYTMSYDAAGNLTNDTFTGEGARTYDAENRMTGAQASLPASYAYDGDGRRVQRIVGSTATWQVYGIGGELIAEYAANGNAASPQKEYGYRNGELLITAEAGVGGGGGETPTSGLKGHWKFDENSGTTAADSSGNNNTGTLTGGASWGSGQSGAAGSFDGVNAQVQVGAQSSLGMTNALTLSGWMYPTGPGATYGGMLVSKEGEYQIARFPDGALKWALANTSPGWAWVDTGYVVPLNQWTHVTLTYDNGVGKTYVNGTLVHTLNGSGSIGDIEPSQNDFRIGGRQSASYQNFQGRIDDVRAYNRALTASEVSTVAATGGGVQNVTWTNTVGVSVTGNTITKTASGDSWNAGAVSTQSIAAGNGYVEFTAAQMAVERVCGLSNGDSNQSHEDIDFGILLSNGGYIYAWESGVMKASAGSYASGDILRVAVESGVVKYYKNGTLFYTSTVGPSYPLIVDTAIMSNGASISNVVISGTGGGPSSNWTNAVGVSVNGNTITKTASGDSWNAGAVSTQSIAAGNGYVEFTAAQLAVERICGLSNGDSNQSHEDIDFGILLSNGGYIYAWESGVMKANAGSYATGDTLRVAVESGVVKYYKNGTLFYTSTATPSYPLIVDTAIMSNGASISNVVISGAGGGGSGSSSATVRWLVTDHLGTPRMVFDQTGDLTVLDQNGNYVRGVTRHDYLPFGEELFGGTGGRTPAQGYGGDNVRQKFTSKERDNETGLDYFIARYYSSSQGRFTSPDEFTGGPDELFYFADDASANPTFYADLLNPQSLNKYQYAYNNPLRYVDPDGHDPEETLDQDPQCKCGPAGPSRAEVDALGKAITNVLDAAAAATGIEIVADAIRENGPAAAKKALDFASTGNTAGDASCPACNSSQRMGQSLMENSNNKTGQGKPSAQQQGQAQGQLGQSQESKQGQPKKSGRPNDAAKEAFKKEAGSEQRKIIRDRRHGGTGRIKGVGAGKVTYRPKGRDRYSVDPKSGKKKDTLHFP